MGTGKRVDFDVGVVGAGMVGLCFAALAAQDERLASWRIVIVEPTAATPPRDDRVNLRVSALSRASERILRAAEAWPALAERACPYSEMVVWDAASRSDAWDALHFTAAETGEADLGHIVENVRVQWAFGKEV